MLELIIAAVAGMAAGVVGQAWRTARKTGQSIGGVIVNSGGGGPKPTK